MTDSDHLLQSAASHFGAGRFAEAADIYADLIRRHPNVVALHINHGAATRGAGDLPGAERAYREALSLEPRNAQAWFNLGNLLRDQKRATDALDAYRRADAAQPNTPEILNNIGVQLYELGRIQDALDVYDAILAQSPTFADALTNRGNAKQRLNDMPGALRDLDAALAIVSDHPVYRLNKSSFLAANGLHDEALDWANKALDADPSYTHARLKRASLKIQRGDLAGGFDDYESRFDIPGWHSMPDRLAMPIWDGSTLAAKHLIVWNEQGYGDALMYARFLPRLAEMADRLTFMCEKPLMKLFRASFSALNNLEIMPLDALPDQGDCHISIMSVPHRLNITSKDLRPAAPYLRSPPEKLEFWRTRVEQDFSDTFNVGVVWAGNPDQAHDYARSMPYRWLNRLLDIPGLRVFNLLIGPRGDEWCDDRLIDFRDEINDFGDSAALMQCLDHIVSVDSAPAHLAGALGCPASILLSFDPDSRYFLNSTLMPWYPTATLYRQTAPGDWVPPAAAVCENLEIEAAARQKR